MIGNDPEREQPNDNVTATHDPIDERYASDLKLNTEKSGKFWIKIRLRKKIKELKTRKKNERKRIWNKKDLKFQN